MNCITLIRRHISKLMAGEIFTTRDLMRYGSRPAIDQSIYKLIKDEVIDRLAYGVFVNARSRKREYSAVEIAWIKANKFGKQIFDHASKLAFENQISLIQNDKNMFALNRSSSSIRSVVGRIKVRMASGRKQFLNDYKIGDVIRGLWNLGEANCRMKDVEKVTSKLNRHQAVQLLDSAAWMPYWLLEMFREALGNLWQQIAAISPVGLSRKAGGDIQKTLNNLAKAAKSKELTKNENDPKKKIP